MKTIFSIFALFLLSNFVIAQDKDAADQLVNEGVLLHDAGNYKGAIEKYNQALEKDDDNLMALAEMAMTYITTGQYEVGITYCVRAIEKHKGSDLLMNVYVSYGNALDLLKRTPEAIKVYDHGIKEFPFYYQLYFNKGISYSSVQKYDSAILCFEKSASLNPKHPGTHNALARTLHTINKKIPALLAYSRFMCLEPASKRAGENRTFIQELVTAGAKKTGKNSVTVNLDPLMFADTTADGKNKENNFASVELTLSLASSLNLTGKESKKMNEAQKLEASLESLCSSLKESKDKNSGFYWEYYAPFLIEMEEKKLLETFSYVVLVTADDAKVTKWIKANEEKLKQFFSWADAYKWPEAKN